MRFLLVLTTILPSSLFLLLLLRAGAGGGGTVTAAATPRSQSRSQKPQRVSFVEGSCCLRTTTRREGPFLLGTVLRGGSEAEEVEEDEEENDDDDDHDDEELEVKVVNDVMTDDDSEAVPLDLSKVLESAADYTHTTVVPVTKKALAVLFKLGTKATMATVHALQRAVEAAMEGDEMEEDDDDDEGRPAEVSVVQRVVLVVKRMVAAAFTFPEEDGPGGIMGGIEEAALKTNKKTKPKQPKGTSTKALDFGSYLAASYGVQDTRTIQTPGTAVFGGSFATAMNEARAQARLLVIFLPVEKYKKGKESREATAIESILSTEVADASNQPARKGEDTGSFLFWSAKLGSSEATQAIKRLKAKIKTSKGSKCPVLMVVYPAMVVDGTTGASKMVPKVVAQHHCSPPPSSETMATWLSSLRKRHGKQYLAMQTVLKELQYFKERKEGYQESKKSDKDRQKREQEEAQRLLEEQQAEQERLEALEERRKDLLKSLPQEATGKDAKKIALRFADGRSAQRSFHTDQPLTDVFNWVDAMYEMERETVILTTMNGKQTYVWGDHAKSLMDAGVDKNTGFRVSSQEGNVEEANPVEN